MKKNACYFTCLCLFSSMGYAIPEYLTLPPTPTTQADQKSSLNYFVDASFIYWYTKEDGLDIATSSILGANGRNFLSPTSEVLTQSFSYEPGFKVGLGVQGDFWSLQAQYTWLRSTTTTNESAPANTTTISGDGVWNLDSWFLQSTAFQQSITANSISSTWHLGFDNVDLLASSLILQQKNITLSSFLGLSSVWIRQNFNLSIDQARNTVGSLLPPQPIQSINSSHSWGIGPKLGLDSQYSFGQGVRLEGFLGASLLYTRFTSINHYEDSIVSSAATNSDPITANVDLYSSVRPVLETGIGLGWGIDLGNNGCHFDILASYDFHLFWGQNFLRHAVDRIWVGTSPAAADLYLQGLTVEASFQF
jgi:hypothetical protein